jgi:hypothetical protein
MLYCDYCTLLKPINLTYVHLKFFPPQNKEERKVKYMKERGRRENLVLFQYNIPSLSRRNKDMFKFSSTYGNYKLLNNRHFKNIPYTF